MAKTVTTAATKALQQELKSLQKEPLEGFTVQLVNDNLFEWEVAIFGNFLNNTNKKKATHNLIVQFSSSNSQNTDIFFRLLIKKFFFY
jgi:ubiquitin-protein ligase